jgi:hypothetical protein
MMDMLNTNWTDPGGRLTFIAWLFMPVFVMMLAMMWAEWRRAGRVRRFRCRDAGREVEVWFVGSEVRACSAFESPRAIACRRACGNAAYRRQWEPALPVLSRRPRERDAAA